MPTNPYPALLARALEQAGARVIDPGRPGWGWILRHRRRVQVLHLHWLHVFYRIENRELVSIVQALEFCARLLAARLLGYRLVWTLHDPRPYDSTTPLADRIARTGVMNLAEVIIHCGAARALLRRRKLLGGGVHRIDHGSYAGVYPDAVDREAARGRLGIAAERVVFLAFGMIRAYKGLRNLLAAFEALGRGPGGSQATLLIAGKPRGERDAAATAGLRRAYEHLDIRWFLEFVPGDEVQLYMRAADFAVAAFEEILVSGSAILALSFGVPLVAPRLGCLPELLAVRMPGEGERCGADGGDPGELAGILYDPPAGLPAALAQALTADRARLARNARRRAAQLDWPAIGRAHVALYGGR